MSFPPVVNPPEAAKLVRLAAMAVALALVAASSPAQATDPQGPSLAELAKLVAEQGRALEEQKREIEKLRKQLDETTQVSLSAHNRLEKMAEAAPAPTVSAAVEERLAKIEASVQQIPDVPPDVVSAGDFPGSFTVPGTDAALRIGGLVRATAVNTFGPLGTEDRFVTSSIPVEGSQEAGKEPRFVLTAIPSRFNLDLRTPTGVGAMRAFIEGDFAGQSRVFRLRHAYGQWKGFVIGQTWSTFADPEAEALVGRRLPSPPPCPSSVYFFGAVTSIITASVQVKSTWSPTFTCFSTFLSWILRLYFQPFGPLKVMEGTLGSIASTTAVIVRCEATVPPGFAPVPGVAAAVSVLTGASPGFFRRTVTLS